MGSKIILGFEKVIKGDKVFPFGEGSYLLGENVSYYLDKIEDNITSKNDLIIINAELFSSTLKPADYKGIDLVEWIRIKLQKLNPILVVGFTPIEQLINLKPESITLLGEGTAYRQLPYSFFKLNRLSEKIKPINDKNQLLSQYHHLVEKTFNIIGFEHSFANKYGIRLMKEAFQGTTKERFLIDETNSIKTALDFAKADFLYKNNSVDDNLYFKSQILDRTGRGSLSTFRDLMKEKRNRIFHIDDEGDSQKWYGLIKTIGNLNKGNYKTITKTELIEGDVINVGFVLKEIESFKPNLILVDLRLLGQRESNVEEFYDYTGVELIENIRKINPWIPIIVASATGQIKSLENLQEHPYNINSLWSKPRIDSGKINIYEKLHNLLVKINSALNLYSNDVEKHNIVTDYYLKEYRNRNKTINDFPKCTHYFIDTNCLFNDDKESTRLYLALHRFITKDYSCNDSYPKIIVLRDVISELHLLAYMDKRYIKKQKRYETEEEYKTRLLSSNYGLNRIKQLSQSNTKSIQDFYDSTIDLLGNNIDYKVNESNNAVELDFTKVVSYANSREEAEIIKEEFESSDSKTIIHADDVFRVIFKKRLNSRASKRSYALITSDKALQNLMIKDFEDLNFSIEDNLSEYSSGRYVKISKDGNLKAEIIGEKVFVNTLLDKNEFHTTWFN